MDGGSNKLLSWIEKFALQFLRSSDVCGMCAFGCGENAEMFLFTVDANGGNVFVSVGVGSSGKVRVFSPAFASVPAILLPSSVAQIAPAVVIPGTVDVIDFVARPPTSHECPSDYVCVVETAVYSDLNVAPMIQMSCGFTCPSRVYALGHVRSMSPSEHASFGVIGKHGAKFADSQSRHTLCY